MQLIQKSPDQPKYLLTQEGHLLVFDDKESCWYSSNGVFYTLADLIRVEGPVVNMTQEIEQLIISAMGKFPAP